MGGWRGGVGRELQLDIPSRHSHRTRPFFSPSPISDFNDMTQEDMVAADVVEEEEEECLNAPMLIAKLQVSV